MKKMFLRMFVCLIVICGLTVFTFAGPAEVDGTKCGHGHVKQKLRAYFNQLAEEEFFTGSVLIAQKGKILLTKGYGMANYEEGILNKPKTVFAIASMTKAFTSMSIMLLEERGFLSVDDPVSNYVPELPEGDRITIHHLLTQTSGLFEYLACPDLFANLNNFHTPDDLLQYYMYEPLSFDPGTQHQYSNPNYITLGIIIERVSGMPFRDFIEANILRPLKMRHTSYDPYGEDFPRKAIGYDDISTDPPTRSMTIHNSISYSAGAMCSSVMDLYKWDQALYTDKLVSKETLERMFTPGFGDYGYGWYIDNLEIGNELHKQIWHWGSYFGFHSYIARLVDDEVTVIILRNTPQLTASPYELRPIVTDVTSIIFGED